MPVWRQPRRPRVLRRRRAPSPRYDRGNQRPRLARITRTLPESLKRGTDSRGQDPAKLSAQARTLAKSRNPEVPRPSSVDAGVASEGSALRDVSRCGGDRRSKYRGPIKLVARYCRRDRALRWEGPMPHASAMLRPISARRFQRLSRQRASAHRRRVQTIFARIKSQLSIWAHFPPGRSAPPT